MMSLGSTLHSSQPQTTAIRAGQLKVSGAQMNAKKLKIELVLVLRSLPRFLEIRRYDLGELLVVKKLQLTWGYIYMYMCALFNSQLIFHRSPFIPGLGSIIWDLPLTMICSRFLKGEGYIRSLPVLEPPPLFALQTSELVSYFTARTKFEVWNLLLVHPENLHEITRLEIKLNSNTNSHLAQFDLLSCYFWNEISFLKL